MRRKRILSQKRPAAGGEARERASFLSEIISYEIKMLCGDCRFHIGGISNASCSAKQDKKTPHPEQLHL